MSELPPISVDPKTFFPRNCHLPAMPGILIKIQQEMNAEDINIKKVGELISSEPALAAQVLKMVNAAYFGIKKKISDIVVATAYLGINQVYRIALSITVVNTLVTREKEALGKIWFHSFYTALCAKYLGSKYEPLLDQNELWTAALLHDIGKLVYLKLFPDHYKALDQFCVENGTFFSEAETHYSLPPSARFGAFLCDKWGLSGKIKLACSFHNLSDLPQFMGKGASASFIRLIILGNLLAFLSVNTLGQEKQEVIMRAAQTTLDISENDVLLLMSDIYALKEDVVGIGSIAG